LPEPAQPTRTKASSNVTARSAATSVERAIRVIKENSNVARRFRLREHPGDRQWAMRGLQADHQRSANMRTANPLWALEDE
jgi:hypothetical protein